MGVKKGSNRREFLKKVGLMGAAGAGAMALGKDALAAKDIQGGQEIHKVDDNEKGKKLSYYTWNGYDADGVLNPFRKRYDATINCEMLTSDPDAIMKLKAGATRQFDLITLNNFWSKGMYEDNLILPLDKETFKPYFDNFIPRYKWPFEWAMSDDGKLLGMPQRYGPAGFAINQNAISRKEAEDIGWQLFVLPEFKNKFAILNWDNWVIFGMCNSAGVDPFKEHTDEEMALVEEAAFKWFENAKFVTESEVEVNNATLAGEIDFYSVGSLYTVSPARAEGHWNLYGVIPPKGSQEGGVGGICWLELTNVVNNPKISPLADDFLAYMQEPDVAYQIAMAASTHNPVANMADPKVFAMFSKEDLKAIQYDDLERQLSFCVDYRANPSYLKMMRFYRRAKAAR